MREHVVLMQAMGYRYNTQADRLLRLIRGGYGMFFAATLRPANATIGNEGFSAETDTLP